MKSKKISRILTNAITLMFLYICFSSFLLIAKEEPVFSGDEVGLKVQPTDSNYYLATLINEYRFYDPTFFDDYLLTLGGKNIAHFTKVDGELADIYFYITNWNDLSFVRKYFKENRDELDAISDVIYSKFIVYRSVNPKFEKKELSKKVAQLLSETTSTTLERVLGNSSHQDKIDQAIFQYLKSNGISSLSEIKNFPDIINMLVNKFYMLSTTYFFRGWADIKAFVPYLKDHIEKNRGKDESIKLKVYACSTGEEVLSYAIELLEANIRNFKIFATDINESSIRFAKKYTYPANSIKRLPLYLQSRIHKYFKHNKQLDVLEPKDPELFSSRILYQKQNILEELPKNIPKEFKGPYDLVSILNVLLYLENKAVQKMKDYWRKIIRPSGILVLFDAQYSIGRGTLNPNWALKNFLSVNKSVNIKMPKGFDLDEIVEFYKSRFSSNNELSLLLLSNTLIAKRQLKEAKVYIENYIEKHPLSYKALISAYRIYTNLKDSEKASKVLNTLVNAFPFQLSTISLLMKNKNYRKQEKFLKEIKTRYQYLLRNYRAEPEKTEKIFDFVEPSSKEFNELRFILKSMYYSLILQHYLKTNQDDKVEEVATKGMKLIEELRIKYPEYIATGKFLKNIVNGLVNHFISQDEFEKGLAYCDEGRLLFEQRFADKTYFFSTQGLGKLNLYKAIILEKLDRFDESPSVLDDSIFYLEHASKYIEDIFQSRQSHFFGDLGLAYFLRAKASQKYEPDKSKDFTKNANLALHYFEKALEMNPLYGKNVAKWRDEVLVFMEENGISIPLAA